MYVNISTKAVM